MNAYPEKPIIDETLTYPDEVVDALKKFKVKYKYGKTTNGERLAGMQTLIDAFCEAYKMQNINIVHRFPMPKNSLWSYADLNDGVIVMVGKLSIITLLHEFAHFLKQDHDELFCVAWSLTLFRKVYPIAFEKLVPVGHVMVEPVGG